jgi:hypothetical protein
MKMAWILRCRGSAITIAIPKRRLPRRRRELHPAARVTNEGANLLLSGGERDTQQSARGGGWQSPSAAGGATAVCLGEMLCAHTYSGVAAKVPGVLRRIHRAGNRDFSFCGRGVNSPDAAYRYMRGHAGLGDRERVETEDKGAGFGLSDVRLCASHIVPRIV